MMDFERAAKVSGARFVYLKGALSRLERALGMFMLDLHTEQFGYTEMAPPILARNHAFFGTTQLPKFENDQFWAVSGELLADASADTIREQRYGLIPTAEVTLTNYVRDEILDEDKLPYRFTAWTPCFRAEAGAAGKDTRGMIRQHQFSKVELVSITTPEQSDAEHERMTDCAQEVLKRLGLHHRVMTLCAGDMGFAAQEDLRHRGLAAGAEAVPRDLVLLELRRLPGAAHERALSAQGCQEHALRPHAERLGPRGRPHADRGHGELPAGGRLGRGAGRAAAVYGRDGEDPRLTVIPGEHRCDSSDVREGDPGG